MATWRQAGHQISLWCRDDDATGWVPQLERLLVLSERYQIPVTIAVVPDAPSNDPSRLDELERRLRAFPLVTVAQHGTDHVSARDPLELPAQFADDLPEEAVAERIARGRSALSEFLRFEPVYVPPWNMVQSHTIGALKALGFRGYSACDTSDAASDLPHLGVHVDILVWKPLPGFRGERQILDQLTHALRRRRRDGLWTVPVGFLSHHLMNDEATWVFLERFFSWTAHQRDICWRSLTEGLAESATTAPRRASSRPVAWVTDVLGTLTDITQPSAGRAIAASLALLFGLLALNINSAIAAHDPGELASYLFPSVDDGTLN